MTRTSSRWTAADARHGRRYLSRVLARFEARGWIVREVGGEDGGGVGSA